VHRLRALAVQKLAAAYCADEVAASVMVMQGGSVFDDIAQRVLRHDPQNPDAQYVHFFHEKIPSRYGAPFLPRRAELCTHGQSRSDRSRSTRRRTC
jgi:hypothetical protein